MADKTDLKPLARVLFKNMGDGSTLKMTFHDVSLPPYNPTDVRLVMQSAEFLRSGSKGAAI